MLDSPAVILFDAEGKALAVRDGVAIPANTPGMIPLGKGTDGYSYFLRTVDDGGVQRLAVQTLRKSGDDKVQLYDGTTVLAVKDATAIPANTPGLIPLGKLASDGKSYFVEVVDDGGTKRLLVAAKVGGWADKGSAPVGFPVLIGGWDGTSVRIAYTDTIGRFVTVSAGSAASRKGFCDGRIILASTAITPVRETTYTEQTTNAQRSIASASASDAAAGTGARTVKIVYYDQTMAGPYEETITLNGTSYVNTVATDICFICKMEVLTVGSGGTNAGIITLKAATAGGGATIWTIAVGSGQTFGAHHYVENGKNCYITGFHGGIKGADTTGFVLKKAQPTVANSFEKQISDQLRVMSSGAFFRSYDTPIVVAGPARITAYVVSDSTSSRTYYASFDYYEQVG